MKKSTLLLGFVLVIFTINAQITINQANFPMTTPFQYLWNGSKLTGIALPSSGQNQLWKYQNLVVDSVRWFSNFVAVTNVNFPKAQRLLESSSILGSFTLKRDFYMGTTVDGNYYYGATTRAVEFPLTAVTGGANDKLAFAQQDDVYASPLKIFPLPCTYNANSTSISRYKLNFQLTIAAYGINQIPGQEVGTATWKIETIGSGIFNIPVSGGVSAPMEGLLVKSTVTSVDSFYLGGQPMQATLLGAFGLSQKMTSVKERYEIYIKDWSEAILIMVVENNKIGSCLYATQNMVKNTAPAIANNITKQQIKINSPLQYIIPTNTFSDADKSDILTITVENLPAWLTYNQATKTVSGTPTAVGSSTVTVKATDFAGQSVSTNLVVEVISATTGVENNQLQNVMMYPNPVKNYAIVKNAENAKITILSAIGQNLLEIEHASDSQFLNISILSNGVYMVKIAKGADVLTKRMVIQK